LPPLPEEEISGTEGSELLYAQLPNIAPLLVNQQPNTNGWPKKGY
jgi:hypothetical protein